MRRLRLVLFCLALAPFFTIPLRADVAEDLSRMWKGKVLTLRVADAAEHIKFNAQGERLGRTSEGIWATDAMIKVDSVAMQGEELRIKAQRVANYFDPGKGVFARALTGSKVLVEIGLSDRSVTVEQLMPVLTTIFATASQKLADIAPAYWKSCLEGGIVREEVEGKPDWRCHDETGDALRNKSDLAPKEVPGFGLVYRVGSEVDGAKISVPKALSTPDPQYTEIARQAKYQGTTILWLIIDREGKPTNIRVVRPLGLGLDDAAVLAVEKWQFRPAMKGSEPVPIMINVEVNFRLYR